MSKPYHQAPLPFIGQKRSFLKRFSKILTENIKNDGAGWTIIDVFGGSGLLAHTAKHCKPLAHVIYNDFDGYAERIKNIDDTNRMRQLLESILVNTERGKLIDDDTKQRIIKTITSFNGYIDVRSIATWLLFSGKQVKTLDEMYKYKWYNRVRRSDYNPAHDYLNNLEIVCESYTKLIPRHQDNPQTLFLLDPPYLNTGQGAYKNNFAIVDFLRLISITRPPYIFFSAAKSELLEYMEYLNELNGEDWERLGGFEKVAIKSQINHSVSYEDNMIFKFAE